MVRIDIKKMEFLPAVDRPGVEILPLFSDGRENVRIERAAASLKVNLSPAGGMELLVLDGGFTIGEESFEAQSWLRLPPGEPFQCNTGEQGAKLWIKSGHLARPQTAPQGDDTTQR